MKLELIKASEKYRDQIADMLDEWSASGEKIFPRTIRRGEYHDFHMYLSSLEAGANGGLSPETTYFCLDRGRNLIVGAVSIRHCLSAEAVLNGGHIQAGVRPSQRRKGIAARMTALALEECRAYGMDKALMVCDKRNAAWKACILRCGGVPENGVNIGADDQQQYLIDLTGDPAFTG